MNIIILAGGQGSRIKSLFPDIPKCLIPVHEIPFMEFQINYLAKKGFKNFFFSLGYMSELVVKHISLLSCNYNIKFCIENEKLGTLGAIKFTFDYFNLQNSFIINGDTFFDVDQNELINNKIENYVEIFGIECEERSRYGSIEIKNNEIISFNEKEKLGRGIINSGLYRVSIAELNLILKDNGSWEHEAIPFFLDIEKLNYKKLSSKILHDIGTPTGYKNFINNVENFT
jgi:D-glycero-alpha-D-manno-heptose 1-phosphate guanylyltransferase